MTLPLQDAIYRPDPAITPLAPWIGDPVHAAPFPQTLLRFRNDRAAAEVGLSGLSDAAWIAHFGRFQPLPENLPQPLALRYHGHQFRHYNQDLGDGRLTLKGAVREILATELLAAQGVNTSRTFSVIETGEDLVRGDEPSPTRSAVMVRLSHGHIRIGTFQRLAALGLKNEMAQLVDFALTQFPGPQAPDEAQERDLPTVRLLHQVVERMADLAASYMVAGFVHGVLNSDNMNVSGESFDYGPWRWLPKWDPAFTAAYFDHQGLYAFGRQPEAIHWNCGQLAVALRSLCEAPPLIAALERFPELYRSAMARRWCWRLGVVPHGFEPDTVLNGACERAMLASGESPDRFFFAHRGLRTPIPDAPPGYRAADGALDHAWWADPAPQSLLIDEVEAIWAPIAAHDDWTMLETKVAALRRMGDALAPAPVAAGQAGP